MIMLQEKYTIHQQCEINKPRTNQYIAEAPEASCCIEAAVINKNPVPIIIKPIIILKSDVETLLCNFRFAHIEATVVPKKYYKHGI